MMIPALLSLALQAAPASTPAEARTVTVSVTDEKGGPVTGLRPEEVAVLENGVARDVSRLEPETRPLTVAVIVDSSEPIAGFYRLSVVDAVARFLGRLPGGTRYALWTTGDRPNKVVDFTDDVARAGRALKRTFPRGGNTLFDAIIEASDDLKQKEGQRTAVVVVSGNGLGFTNYDRFSVVDRALKNAHSFMIVNFQEGAGPGDPALGGNDAMGRVGRADYDFVLGTLADRSGGLREVPLSAMGVDRSLEKIAASLGGQYRITYSTLPDLKDRKLEVKVARPGVKVLLGGSRS
jgi:VWFA-related protein